MPDDLSQGLVEALREESAVPSTAVTADEERRRRQRRRRRARGSLGLRFSPCTYAGSKPVNGYNRDTRGTITVRATFVRAHDACACEHKNPRRFDIPILGTGDIYRLHRRTAVAGNRQNRHKNDNTKTGTGLTLLEL